MLLVGMESHSFLLVLSGSRSLISGFRLVEGISDCKDNVSRLMMVIHIVLDITTIYRHFIRSPVKNVNGFQLKHKTLVEERFPYAQTKLLSRFDMNVVSFIKMTFANAIGKSSGSIPRQVTMFPQTGAPSPSTDFA